MEFYLNFLETFFLNTKIFFFSLFERILTKKKPFLFKLNHWDYNFFLHAKKNKKHNFKKKNYCIYIESTAPFYEGDYKLFKQKRYITKKVFYNSINTFFNQIEKKLNVQVLVLLHPKAIYLSNSYNYYGNRKIIQNKNVQVFKNCKFVMHRGSTAFSYAVFFNKPSIILASQELLDKDIYNINYLNHFSKETGSKIVNINLEVKKNSLLKKLKINKKKYEVYKNKLVPFENKSNNNLLINYLNKKT